MKVPPFIFKLSSYIPFGFTWITKKMLGNPKTVLDLGCGKGELMGSLREDRNWNITGVDIFKSSLKEAAKTGVYKELIQADIVRVSKKMVKEKRKFDLVFASGVIEHITRSDGEKLLDLVEDLAKQRIFFNTPNEFMEQPDDYMLNNPHQEHKSGWTVKDFTSRGYKVYGLGFAPFWTESGPARSNNLLIALLARTISYILSPVTFLFPSISSGIMAIKRVGRFRKQRRQKNILYMILFIALSVFFFIKVSGAVPSNRFLYSVKRLYEKTWLNFQSDPVDKLNYQYKLLDNRLRELEFVAENGISQEILTSSLRYSTTVGQITELIVENDLKEEGVRAINKFENHRLIVKDLPQKYAKEDGEVKFLVDAANYLVEYKNQLSTFIKSK